MHACWQGCVYSQLYVPALDIDHKTIWPFPFGVEAAGIHVHIRRDNWAIYKYMLINI